MVFFHNIQTNDFDQRQVLNVIIFANMCKRSLTNPLPYAYATSKLQRGYIPIHALGMSMYASIFLEKIQK